AMRKQIAGDADLVRRRDSPSCRRRIADIVWSNAEAKTFDRMPRNNPPDRRVRERTTLWAHPERIAIRMPKHPPACTIKISGKVRSQEFRHCELDGGVCLGFFRRDDDKPAVALSNELTIDFKGNEILAPQGNEGEQRDHQTVPILDG